MEQSQIQSCYGKKTSVRLCYWPSRLIYIMLPVMRLFKPLEHLQAALRAVQSSTAPLEQFTTIGRQLGYFGYLSYDMIVWVVLLT